MDFGDCIPIVYLCDQIWYEKILYLQLGFPTDSKAAWNGGNDKIDGIKFLLHFHKVSM